VNADSQQAKPRVPSDESRENDRVRAHFTKGLGDLAALAATVADELQPQLVEAARLVRETVARRGTLFFCGNGGSAADAQHLATEYVVRYSRERAAYPAVALTTDTSLLTAAANDFGFEQVFARQVEALVKAGDLLVVHSTSGASPNVLRAAEAALAKGVSVLAFSARDGGPLRSLATHCVVIPTSRTDRAQELHLCIEHLICDLVEQAL
jgi:D-sedoheptulose 7-phosphate isomerase